MWAPLLEKAFAKMKGHYLATKGGYTSAVLHALTGYPAFTFWDIK